MDDCHSCGRTYDDSFADWTICRDCKQRQMEEYHGGPVYVDDLGIPWSQSELMEAGGREEVDRMVAEADVRNNLPKP